MDILNAIVGAQDGTAVRQLGATFGLDEAQAASALSALVPALAGGVQRNLKNGSASSMGGVLGGLTGGSGGGLSGGLGSLLDRNGDGSIGDDVAGMLGKFLSRG